MDAATRGIAHAPMMSILSGGYDGYIFDGGLITAVCLWFIKESIQ